MEFKLERCERTLYAYGDFTSWEEYSIDHAPDTTSFDAIDAALNTRDPALLIDGKSAEELHYNTLFSSPTEAEAFEAQCLALAMDAINDESKKFVLAGINHEPIPGYWNWLSSQCESTCWGVKL